MGEVLRKCFYTETVSEAHSKSTDELIELVMDIDARLKNDGIDAGTRRVLRRTELALWDIVRERNAKGEVK